MKIKITGIFVDDQDKACASTWTYWASLRRQTLDPADTAG